MWPFNRTKCPVPSRERIRSVTLFVVQKASGKAIGESTGVAGVLDMPDFFPAADSKMGLDGALVDFIVRRGYESVHVDEMSDPQWIEFLKPRFSGQRFRNWRASTSFHYYVIVVVLD